MTRKDQTNLISNINSLHAITLAIGTILNLYTSEQISKRGTWGYFFLRLHNWLKKPTQVTPFQIFNLKGNKKLKFATFSSLALADCPGKGLCAKFCYSLKAWRYPAAFLRQLQNSILQRYFPEIIETAFLALPRNITLRLFVDGDFHSVENLAFWMKLIKSRKDLEVYGYSKSWYEFVQLDNNGNYVWPSNYLVNQSSGSKHEKTGIANAFKSLPIVRGEFVATKVDKSWMSSGAYQGKSKEGNKDYRKEVFTNLKKVYSKAFACPGTCFDCLSGGKHACGSKQMKNVAIGIGIH